MIHIEILKEADIDYEAGLTRFGNDKELYEEILRGFANDDTLECAREAYLNKDYRKLCELAHQAKGVTGNVGLIHSYERAVELHVLLRNENYTQDELSAIYESFEAVCSKERAAIKNALEMVD